MEKRILAFYVGFISTFSYLLCLASALVDELAFLRLAKRDF
jgi:hypothetical protein